MQTMGAITYFISFYCTKCKSHITESVLIRDSAFDMVEAFNMVAERNVRGSSKAIGRCTFPGDGHVITSLSCSGIKIHRNDPERIDEDD